MADTNHRIRFMANNLAALNKNSFTFSSEQTGFEANNVLDNFRSTVWRMNGHFELTSSINLIHGNDGSDFEATVAVASYSSPDLLCTAIETALNLVSSNWTCTYDTVGGTFKFTLTNTGSVTLQFSDQTNAIWDTLGFTTLTDATATSFEANEQRRHTNEFLTFDMGWQTPVTFFASVGDISQTFGLSSQATVTLEGNNINLFNSPDFSKTLSVTDKGIYAFNITDTEANYRFWRVNIVDQFNANTNIELGSIYMGDYETLTTRNISIGFQNQLTDNSDSSESESGVLFFDERTKFTQFNNLKINFMEKTDYDVILDLYSNVGRTQPFFVSLDPLLQLSTDITEWTKLVVFKTDPILTNIRSCRFSTTLNLREVV